MEKTLPVKYQGGAVCHNYQDLMPFYQIIWWHINHARSTESVHKKTNESPAGSNSEEKQINPELKPRNLQSRFTTNKNTHLFNYSLMLLNV